MAAGLAHLRQALSGNKQPLQDYTFTATNGLKLAYSITGSGPLLVAQTPGWGIGKGYLERFLAPLAEKYTLLSFVSRGTLPSERPVDDSAMSTADMSEDIEALRLHLDQDKLTLFGHSNGSSIIQAYASKYPSHVDKLLLISSQLIGFDDSATFQKFAQDRAADPRYANALASFPKVFTAQSDDEMTDTLVNLMPFYFAHPETHAKAWQEMVAASVVQLWPFARQRKADNNQPMPELEKIQAKTLIMAGDQDPFCTVKTAERIHASVPSSRLVVLNDCGHFLWSESKEEFFTEVLKFLGE
ncbi:alpha/beta-hydrolase [Elaphomyces granulatus]